MTQIEILASNAEANLGLLKLTLADFSDAEMLARPTPNANHAAWQVGHAMASEVSLVNMAKPGVMPEPPERFVG
jgi:hypothetical protein